MILKIIYGLVVLGIIIFIHESGHLLSSILCGVKVDAFSIGMGPVLFHKTIKGIDWRISLFPIGGYCAMKGEDDLLDAYENNLPLENLPADSFYGVHALKRAIIAFCGPLFNLLLTILCTYLVAVLGYSYWSASNQIIIASEIDPQIKSAAAQAGLLTGDKIIKINNTQINDFSDLYTYISVHGDQNLTVQVLRDEITLTFNVHTDVDKTSGAGRIGVMSDPKTAEKREAQRYGLLEAIPQSIKETWNLFTSSIYGILTLFKGVKITEAVSGPASITTMLGETVQSGFAAGIRTGLSAVLNFAALISMSLFIMNLLPVPVLDGGLILFSLIEAIFRIHISPKVRYRVQYIGLAFIAFLFIISVMGDFNYFMRLFNEN